MWTVAFAGSTINVLLIVPPYALDLIFVDLDVIVENNNSVEKHTEANPRREGHYQDDLLFPFSLGMPPFDTFAA